MSIVRSETVPRLPMTIFFVGALFFAASALSDVMRPSLLALSELEGEVWRVSLKQPLVNGRFLNLSVKTNCIAGELISRAAGTAVHKQFDLNCGVDGLKRIEIQGLVGTLVDMMVTVRDIEGQQTSHLLTSLQPVVTVGERAPAVPVYVVLGIEHLIFGFDHVLFVLVLLYIVQGWKNLLKVVTSFTLAHSVTLVLSSLNLLKLTPAPVEALISLSIVFLAAEALRQSKGYMTRVPWVVAGLFGLLHGLGFAGALAEIGLPEESAILALLFFNIGIEIGQLVVVAAALLFVALLNRLIPKHRNHALIDAASKSPLYCIGCLAGYWFVERALTIVV